VNMKKLQCANIYIVKMRVAYSGVNNSTFMF